MSMSVKVILDSVSEAGVRITTFQLRYQRFFHSEFMTHRVFSRNASSSRAIPVMTMLKQVWSDPAMPVHWGENRPGMQAKSELKGFKRKAAEAAWRTAGKLMCGVAYGMTKIGLHKQVANRILEPWQYISVIVTSTEWDNFFDLRDHPDAQPEIRALAEEMRRQMIMSMPQVLRTGEWHIPYVSKDEQRIYPLNVCLKLSTARCARVSYLTHYGKKPDVSKDEDLHDKLVASEPIHASPTEHASEALQDADKWVKNFRGWKQYRCVVEDNLIHA